MLSVPDAHVTETVDVRPWRDRKWAAILAHRSQVERGARAARDPLPAPRKRSRDRVLGTEYYSRVTLAPGAA
ncbi:hypothetical protein LT493_00600 [Streptomyces tricolor]|nr:hypothetical protein [Streptomyces tricolor]